MPEAWAWPPRVIAVGGAVEHLLHGEGQREAYEAIRRGLADEHVHMAITSDAGLGKTVLLEAVLTNLVDHDSRVIHIREPDGLDLEQVRRIERIASARPEHGSVEPPHTVIAVDDAHTAPFALLRCLAAITTRRKGERRVIQVILAGRPQLWGRLANEDFAAFAERLVLRLVLGGFSDDDARSYLHRVLAEPRRVAGQVITPDAEKEIVHLAAGRPGRIGAIVMKALERTDATRSPSIGIDEARAAAAEIDGRAAAIAVPVAY